MVREARDRGVPVSMVIETKHPNPRGADVEYRVAEQLAALGWDAPGSPVRVISFDQAAVERLGRLLPQPGTHVPDREDLRPLGRRASCSTAYARSGPTCC